MITTPHCIAYNSSGFFNHSQLDALSAACPSAFTAALRCLPTMPRELNVVHTDCAGKPRQPTSTGNSQVCRSVYLSFFNYTIISKKA